MTPTQQERRIQALYDDFNVPRRNLCERVVHLEADMEDVRAENAKLRELLRDYHRYEHEDCHSCRYVNECRADESGRCIAPVRLGERYRELGVEP